jgi:predicted PurR-regulated permease PerM
VARSASSLPSLAVAEEFLHEERRRIRQRTLAVVAVLLGVVAVVWLAMQISTLLLMVFVSLFVAVALEPPVHLLTKRGWRRGAATGVVFLASLLAIIAFLVALAPLLVNQVDQLVDRLPGYALGLVDFLNDSLGIDFSAELEAGVEDEASTIADWIAGNAGGLLGGIVGVGAAIGSVFFFVTTVGLFSFYIVAELPKLQRTVLSFMPERQQRESLRVWDVAVEKMGGYIYSRLVLALTGGLVSAIFLSLMDVPFALSLGIWVGVLSQFIPVVGTYLAAILPAVVAVSSPGGIRTVIWVIIFFVTYQQVENLLISPRVTRRTMSIHPAVSIAAIIVGGNLMGAVGIMLALPMTGVVQALISESGRRHDVILDEPEDPVPAEG